MVKFHPKRILVPVATEGKEEMALTRRAIDAAADLAEKYESEVVLLHLEPIVSPGSAAGMDMSGRIYHTVSMVMQAKLLRGEKQLQKLQEKVEDKGVPVETKIMDAFESIPDAICTFVPKNKIDMVVVATHAYKGLQKIFFGSISEKLINRLHVPVLVLPPKK